jgi:hypothetical protein
MDGLALGDQVQCVLNDGTVAFCSVYNFDNIVTGGKLREHITIDTGDFQLKVSRSHNVYVSTDASFVAGSSFPNGEYRIASSIQVGDRIVVQGNTNSFEARTVQALTSDYNPGAYTPHLLLNNVPVHSFFVNGILVSAHTGRTCGGSQVDASACDLFDVHVSRYFDSTASGFGANVDSLPTIWGWATDGMSPEMQIRYNYILNQRALGFVLDPVKFTNSMNLRVSQVESMGHRVNFLDVWGVFVTSFVPAPPAGSGKKFDKDGNEVYDMIDMSDVFEWLG